MTKLEARLRESIARVEIEKLAQRIVALEKVADQIGPRVLRARAHYLEQDRIKLVVKLQRLGFEVQI